MSINQSALEKELAKARKHMESVFHDLRLPKSIGITATWVASYGAACAWTNGLTDQKAMIWFAANHPNTMNHLRWEHNKVVIIMPRETNGVIRHELAHIYQTRYEALGFKDNYSTHESDSWLKVISTWAERVHGKDVFLSFDDLKYARYLSNKQVKTTLVAPQWTLVHPDEPKNKGVEARLLKDIKRLKVQGEWVRKYNEESGELTATLFIQTCGALRLVDSYRSGEKTATYIEQLKNPGDTIMATKYPDFNKAFGDMCSHFVFNYTKEEITNIASAWRNFMLVTGKRHLKTVDGKQMRDAQVQKTCNNKACQKSFVAKTTKARYCCNSCRVKAFLAPELQIEKVVKRQPAAKKKIKRGA